MKKILNIPIVVASLLILFVVSSLYVGIAENKATDPLLAASNGTLTRMSQWTSSSSPDAIFPRIVDKDVGLYITGSTQCLQVDSTGVISGTGGSCGGSGSQTPWTEDIDGAGYNLSDLGLLDFSTSSALTAGVGQLTWNEDEGTLDLGLTGGNVTNQLGQETQSYIKAGENLTDGDVVYISGAVGASGKIEVSKFTADNTVDELHVIGLITETISIGNFGYLTSYGKVRGIQTDGANYGETWIDDTLLYASAATSGALTSIAPIAPNQAIPMATVVSAHTSNGTIFVQQPSKRSHLDELHDVYVASIADKNALLWNTSNSRWENRLITASDVAIALGGGSPTVDQIQEYIDNNGSSGFYLGGTLSDGGAGTLDVAAGSGFIRTTNDENAELQSFKWSASSSIPVTDNTTQYVYVDDSGDISLSTSEFLEAPDKIIIGVVTDESGAIIHEFALGVRLQESIGAMGRYIRQVEGIQRNNRVGGLIFGQSGDANRDVTLTAGQLEWGRTPYPFSAIDTSGVDTFFTYSASGQEDAVASQWPNTQYDSAGTLTTMNNNRWANLFFWLEPDGHLIMVYGRSEFTTEAQAENEGVPSSSLPSRITETGLLAGRFTFQKSANSATISSAFEELFANAGVTDHGNLAGLTDTSDHPYALLIDGTRALTGAWDMASFSLTNVNIDSGVITGITDLAIADGGTGLSAVGTGIDTWWATPSSANLASAITDETGTGVAVFGTNPTIAGLTGTGVWDLGGGTSFELPNSSDPTVNASGEIAINTGTSSIRFYDGTAERQVKDEMPLIATTFASSTLAYDGSYGASGTTTEIRAGFKYGVTFSEWYCKTDVGTVFIEVGNGTATTSAQCTVSGVATAATTAFEAREPVYVDIGTSASDPNRIPFEVTGRWTTD